MGWCWKCCHVLFVVHSWATEYSELYRCSIQSNAFGWHTYWPCVVFTVKNSNFNTKWMTIENNYRKKKLIFCYHFGEINLSLFPMITHIFIYEPKIQDAGEKSHFKICMNICTIDSLSAFHGVINTFNRPNYFLDDCRYSLRIFIKIIEIKQI